MRYTKSQFLDDVKKEAKALKEHATKEEIRLLSLGTLDPQNKLMCIYGQMTGTCVSRRAAELIDKCCKKYFKLYPQINTGMRHVSESLMTSINEFVSERSESLKIKHLSSIETYIMQPFAKNDNLIAYLKGETKKLEL